MSVDRKVLLVGFDRIDPEIMGGVTCIRGLRIPVATVVTMVAEGLTTDEILADLPDLEAEDIRAALRYAARGHAGGAPPPQDVRFLLDNNLFQSDSSHCSPRQGMTQRMSETSECNEPRTVKFLRELGPRLEC